MKKHTENRGKKVLQSIVNPFSSGVSTIMEALASGRCMHAANVRKTKKKVDPFFFLNSDRLCWAYCVQQIFQMI